MEGLQILMSIEDPVMIDVRLMSWVILRTAASNAEAGLNADRTGTVVYNVSVSADGPAYAPKQTCRRIKANRRRLSNEPALPPS